VRVVLPMAAGASHRFAGVVMGLGLLLFGGGVVVLLHAHADSGGDEQRGDDEDESTHRFTSSERAELNRGEQRLCHDGRAIPEGNIDVGPPEAATAGVDDPRIRPYN
jgi:hypothetical protein